jgi:hypothetical protein
MRLYRCSRSVLLPPLLTRRAREEDADELLRLWRSTAATQPHMVQLQVRAAPAAGTAPAAPAGVGAD